MTDTGNRAKSKRDEVDWDAIKSRFLPMETLPKDLIASRTEGERALAAFNRALEQSKTGNSDVAMIVLGKLTSRWPTFLAASTLYGVLLAEARRYAEAEQRFEQVLLQAPDSEDARTIEYCRMAVREERIREEARDRSRKIKEQKLMPVRARMARSGILQKAADDTGAGRTQMASRREQENVLKMGEDDTRMTAHERRPFTRAIRVLAISVIVVAVLFLVFYFAIRPSILAAEQRRQRLEWLEHQLTSEQVDDNTARKILEHYRRAFSLDDALQPLPKK
ncbi:MAG: hypothetical protein GX910_00925 [Clostridiaceae bacterium]|jgi:tetratricopeptide (TPR) repeat protein|nr:hypothetical protein [Clostridiaceae bacterium]